MDISLLINTKGLIEKKASDKICLIIQKSNTIRVIKLVTVKIWFYKVATEAIGTNAEINNFKSLNLVKFSIIYIINTGSAKKHSLH